MRNELPCGSPESKMGLLQLILQKIAAVLFSEPLILDCLLRLRENLVRIWSPLAHLAFEKHSQRALLALEEEPGEQGKHKEEPKTLSPASHSHKFQL